MVVDMLPRYLQFILIRCCLLLFGVMVASSGVAQARSFHDPYKLFAEHYRVTGGLERWRALRSCYSCGRVRYDGLAGRFEQWTAYPIQAFMLEDYGVIRECSGNDGRVAWHRDYNGQVELLRDEQTVKRNKLARYLADFEHLRRDSAIFHLTMEGVHKREGRRCYVVRMDNTINADVSRFYFDSASLMLVACVTRQPDVEIRTSFADFRRVDGLLFPFHRRDDIYPRNKFQQWDVERLIVNPPVAAHRFAVPPTRLTALVFPHGRRWARLPFRQVEGAIYLPVTVAGARRWWLLDSGASASIVDADFARSLGAGTRGKVGGFGFGKLFTLGFVRLPPLVLPTHDGPLQLGAQIVMSSRGLSAASYEPQIAGILGFDFLSRFIVRIDYAASELTLFDVNYHFVTPPPWQDAPHKYRMPTLVAQVDNLPPGRFSIDTGAQFSSFFYPYAAANHLLRRWGVEHVSAGMNGVQLDRLCRFEHLRLGRFTLRNPLFNVPAAAGLGTAAVGELAGNLGASALRNFVLWLDCSRQRIALERGTLFNRSLALDGSGMLVGMAEDGRAMVSFVAAGTPAEQAGLHPGDIFEAVDGRPASAYGGVLPLRHLFSAAAGRCFDLVVRRNGRKLACRLCLRDLFAAEPSTSTGE